MSGDAREPIIDAFLEELLGGVQPPDLKQRILSAHLDSSSNDDNAYEANSTDDSPADRFTSERPVLPPSVAALPRDVVRMAPTVTPIATSKRIRRNRSADRFLAAAVVVLVSASLITAWIVQDAQPPRVAQNLPEFQPPLVSDDATAQPHSPGSDVIDAGDLAVRSAPFQGVADQPQESSLTDELRTPETFAQPTVQSVSPDEVIVSFINQRLAAGWAEASVEQTSAISGRDWCERAYECLLGRPPKAGELNRFVADRDRHKRETLIATLCETPRFAANWARFFTTVLVGDAPRTNIDRDELKRYLRRALFDDKPYDELAYELLTAEGSNLPDGDGFNGATNFLLAFQSNKQTTATEKVCQVFLGRQMQCAKCHDHPLNKEHENWRQSKYWQLASYFAQMKALRPEKKVGAKLVNRDFLGESGTPDEAEVFYGNPQGKLIVAYPGYLDGTQPSTRSGLIKDIDRRSVLAAKIVGSEDFSRALVNRMWDGIFGTGFTEPVDDMGQHNPPSHPELLNRLTREFSANNHNLRDLIRWMMLSAAFNRASRPRNEILAADTPLFNYFDDRTTPNPPLGRSLHQVAEARRNGRAFDRTELLAQPDQTDAAARQQDAHLAMAQINAKMSQRLLDMSPSSLLDRLYRSNLSDADKVQHLFLATVGRVPSRREFTDGLAILQRGSQLQALQDIGWILLNSQEFANEH